MSKQQTQLDLQDGYVHTEISMGYMYPMEISVGYMYPMEIP